MPVWWRCKMTFRCKKGKKGQCNINKNLHKLVWMVIKYFCIHVCNYGMFVLYIHRLFASSETWIAVVFHPLLACGREEAHHLHGQLKPLKVMLQVFSFDCEAVLQKRKQGLIIMLLWCNDDKTLWWWHVTEPNENPYVYCQW